MVPPVWRCKSGMTLKASTDARVVYQSLAHRHKHNSQIRIVDGWRCTSFKHQQFVAAKKAPSGGASLRRRLMLPLLCLITTPV
jgi:hypothetical protein